MTDTQSFPRALRHVLRQNPDVIVIGEMRDMETMATALTAAETGHLVLATVHASGVTQTLKRIAGVYEGDAQRQVLLQLAHSLQGIISQDWLFPKKGARRVLAYELLVANSAARNLIRENNLHLMDSLLQTAGKEGMVTLEQCLSDLCAQGKITHDVAVSRAPHPELLG